MQILLVAATTFEIQPFTNINKDIEVLVTGVGVPSAMYHLQRCLHQAKYDFVIQAGIAGAFDDSLYLGEVVQVSQDTFGDIGMEEKESFATIFEKGFADANEFPYTNGWLNNNSPFHNTSIQKVKAVTVNKVSDSLLQKQQLIKTFAPQVETMEGAALHYVCLQENVPFLQLRSISNYVGERDKSKWKMKDAIVNLNNELKMIIELIRK